MKLSIIFVLVALFGGCASGGLRGAKNWVSGEKVSLAYDEPTHLVLDRALSSDMAVVALELVGRVMKREEFEGPTRLRVEVVSTVNGEWHPTEETVFVIPPQEAAPQRGISTEVLVVVGIVVLSLYIFRYGPRIIHPW